MPKRMKLAAFCLTFSTLCHPAFGTDQSAEYESIRCSAPSLRVVHHEEAPVNFQHDRNGNKRLERILKILTSRKNCEPNILAIQEHSGSINYILLDTANFTIVFIGSEGADFESLFATPKEKKARDGILGHDHQYLGIMNIQGKTEELLQKSEEDGATLSRNWCTKRIQNLPPCDQTKTFKQAFENPEYQLLRLVSLTTASSCESSPNRVVTYLMAVRDGYLTNEHVGNTSTIFTRERESSWQSTENYMGELFKKLEGEIGVVLIPASAKALPERQTSFLSSSSEESPIVLTQREPACKQTSARLGWPNHQRNLFAKVLTCTSVSRVTSSIFPTYQHSDVRRETEESTSPASQQMIPASQPIPWGASLSSLGVDEDVTFLKRNSSKPKRQRE